MVAGIILVNKKNMDWFSSCVAHIADAADMVSVVCEDDIVIESEDIKSFSDYSDALIYATKTNLYITKCFCIRKNSYFFCLFQKALHHSLHQANQYLYQDHST